MNAKKLGKFIAENDFWRMGDDLWLVSDFFRFLFLEVRKIGIFFMQVLMEFDDDNDIT